jgi:hypothetical protein
MGCLPRRSSRPGTLGERRASSDGAAAGHDGERQGSRRARDGPRRRALDAQACRSRWPGGRSPLRASMVPSAPSVRPPRSDRTQATEIERRAAAVQLPLEAAGRLEAAVRSLAATSDGPPQRGLADGQRRRAGLRGGRPPREATGCAAAGQPDRGAYLATTGMGSPRARPPRRSAASTVRRRSDAGRDGPAEDRSGHRQRAPVRGSAPMSHRPAALRRADQPDPARRSGRTTTRRPATGSRIGREPRVRGGQQPAAGTTPIRTRLR